MNAWYCAQSKFGQEFVAKDHLEQQDFRVFLPLILQTHPTKAPLIKPMFSGYLFVNFDMEAQRWQSIWSTYGIARLISWSEDRPARIPAGVVESLMNTTVLHDGVPVISPGCKLRVLKGPFINFTGVCQATSSQRVELLLRVMGRESIVVFFREDVEVLHEACCS